MSTFLEKMGLEAHFEVRLKMTEKQFVKALQKRVKPPESRFWQPFLANDDKLQGNVSAQGFTVQSNETYWNHRNMIIADGLFQETENGLVINVTIHKHSEGFLIGMGFVWVFAFVIYLLLLIPLIWKANLAAIALLTLLVLFPTTFPVLIVRNNVSSLKKELMAVFQKLESTHR
jgi:hypothetical protein